jgi:hypothetical protein
MMVETDGCGIYVDGIPAVSLQFGGGRPGSRGNGVVMWSYNAKPLGWVEDCHHLIECVLAAKVFGGELDPHWEEVPTGSRLIHPRYTLDVEMTHSGWLPEIMDGLTRRTHSLRPQPNASAAKRVLEELLRRRVGRSRPSEDWQGWLEPAKEGLSRHPFQLALRSMRAHIEALVRTGVGDPGGFVGEERTSAADLARWVDEIYGGHFDPLPRIGAIVATYIKSSLIALYGGADSIRVGADGSALIFTRAELSAFRERFRRSPMTDREYLNLVDSHLLVPLRGMRRYGKHHPKNWVAPKKSHQPKLLPRRDRDDFPIGWPFRPGSRLWPVETQ